ncbi:DUF3137 domain-containing protein [Hoeflea sp.]|uniref:DUF3137 domain-containing protein n=1 Tax=Hoeflea sp. TaxID=1940281 RepID=UPI003BAF3185
MEKPATLPEDRLEDFDSFFKSRLQPALDDLEATRAARLRIIKILIAIGIVFLAVILFRALQIRDGSGPLFANPSVGFAVFGLMFGPLLAAFWLYWRLTQDYKQVLAAGVCAYYGFSYQRRGFGFPLDRFAPILPPYRQARLEDRISGHHHGIDFSLCEARLTRRSGNDDAKKRDAFNGVLVVFDLPREFNGRTILTPDWSLAGNLAERIRQAGERIELEGAVFETQFEVYSTDRLEAHLIFTPLFMERIVRMAECRGSPKGIGLSFDRNQLLVALRNPRGDSRFEPGHFFSGVPNWRERADTSASELDYVLGVADCLGLRSE